MPLVVVPLLNVHQPVVETNGTMAQHFRDYMNILNRAVPVIGEGTPEGVLQALQYTFYVISNVWSIFNLIFFKYSIRIIL